MLKSTALDAPERLWSLSETAAYLGVPVRTIYDWRLERKGPRAIKVGRYLRYRRSDVIAWLESQADPA